MATSVATLAVQDVDATRRNVRRRIKLTFAAGDYATNGIPLDLTGVTNPNNLPYAKFTSNPTDYRVINPPKLYHLKLVRGTTLASGWLAFISYETGSAGVFAEHAAGALAAGIVADAAIFIEFGSQKGK